MPGLLGDSPFREGAVSGFLLILFSELGDKTFFIAVLLALKEARGIVFAGTFGALAVMTVISVRKCCLLLHSAACAVRQQAVSPLPCSGCHVRCIHVHIGSCLPKQLVVSRRGGSNQYWHRSMLSGLFLQVFNM